MVSRGIQISIFLPAAKAGLDVLTDFNSSEEISQRFLVKMLGPGKNSWRISCTLKRKANSSVASTSRILGSIKTRWSRVAWRWTSSRQDQLEVLSIGALAFAHRAAQGRSFPRQKISCQLPFCSKIESSEFSRELIRLGQSIDKCVDIALILCGISENTKL